MAKMPDYRLQTLIELRERAKDEAERFLAELELPEGFEVELYAAEPLVAIFTDDPEVASLTVDFIWILGAVQPLMAIEFAVSGSLRGAGDTLFPLITIFIGLFVCRLLPVTLLVTFREIGIEVVWSALILDYFVKAMMLLYRFRKGKWKELEV